MCLLEHATYYVCIKIHLILYLAHKSAAYVSLKKCKIILKWAYLKANNAGISGEVFTGSDLHVIYDSLLYALTRTRYS